jgi:peroxiredoxin
MMQLHQDQAHFQEADAEIVIVGPEDQKAFQDFWQKNDYTFVGLPDPEHSVADLYSQQVKLLKFGRMPALVVIDKQGNVRYLHYGNSMQDIPANSLILEILKEIEQGEVAPA